MDANVVKRPSTPFGNLEGSDSTLSDLNLLLQRSFSFILHYAEEAFLLF